MDTTQPTHSSLIWGSRPWNTPSNTVWTPSSPWTPHSLPTPHSSGDQDHETHNQTLYKHTAVHGHHTASHSSLIWGSWNWKWNTCQHNQTLSEHPAANRHHTSKLFLTHLGIIKQASKQTNKNLRATTVPALTTPFQIRSELKPSFPFKAEIWGWSWSMPLPGVSNNRQICQTLLILLS